MKSIQLRDHEVKRLASAGSVLMKPIQDVPYDRYAAGEDGCIYSFKHETWIKLKSSEHSSRKGYQHVSLFYDRKKRTKSVHRMVCSAFHGPCPSKEMECRHLDGNGANNVPSNLAWGTRIENWHDRRAHGRAMNGENHPNSRFSDEERLHIRWAVNSGLCSQHHAARVLGVSQHSIALISNGKTSIFVNQAIECKEVK